MGLKFKDNNYSSTIIEDISVETAVPEVPVKPKLLVRITSPLEDKVALVSAAMPTTSIEHFQMNTTVKLPKMAAFDKSASTSSSIEAKTDNAAASIITPVTPVAETSHAAFEKEMTSMFEAYDRELNSASPNSEKLYMMALQMLAYLMRHTGHTDHSNILELTKKIQENVKDLQGTHHNPGAIAMGAATALLTLASAFCALSPFIGGRLLMAAETTQQLAKISTTIDGTSKIFNFGEKMFENSNNGIRTLFNHHLEVSKELMQTRRSSKNDAEGQKQGAFSTLQEATRSKHQSVQSILGG